MKIMPDFSYEKQYGQYVVGIDEVGRGSLAGPVVAAAVCFSLPEIENESFIKNINDSKLLSKIKREALCRLIHAHAYIGMGSASIAEIDALNIHHATLLAMRRAYITVAGQITPLAALIDGKYAPTLPIPTYTLIKGDQKSITIAAASIIAKVARDQTMQSLSLQYPHYGWETNVGYPTSAHREALITHGITPHHRQSFQPIKNLLSAQ